jgi:hypothetical protein
VVLAQAFDHGRPVLARFAPQSASRTGPPPVRATGHSLSFSPPVASWAAATEGTGSYQVEAFERPLILPPHAQSASPWRPSFEPPMEATPRAKAASRAPAAVALDLREIDEELAALRAPDQAPPPAEVRLLGAGSSGSRPPTAALPGQVSPEEAPAASLTAQSHEVFDRMARGMRYANTFDLGAIELRHRFDRFDREMADEDLLVRSSGAGGGAGRDPMDEDLRMIGALSKLRQPGPTRSFGELAGGELIAGSPSTPAAPPTATTPTAAEPVVRHQVPLVAETRGLGSDAAAAAMVLAWKHKLEPTPEAIAAGKNGWAPFKEALNGSGTVMLDACGFHRQGPELPSSDSLTSLLERFGPVWVGAPEAAVRGRVITGISVDPTRQLALLHIADGRDERSASADPAPRATTYTVHYMQFIRSLPDNAAGWILAYIPVTTGT